MGTNILILIQVFIFILLISLVSSSIKKRKLELKKERRYLRLTNIVGITLATVGAITILYV